jgi:hypothetical protein
LERISAEVEQVFEQVNDPIRCVMFANILLGRIASILAERHFSVEREQQQNRRRHWTP